MNFCADSSGRDGGSAHRQAATTPFAFVIPIWSMVARAHRNLAATALEDLYYFDVSLAETGKTRPLLAQVASVSHFDLIRLKTMIAALPV